MCIPLLRTIHGRYRREARDSAGSVRDPYGQEVGSGGRVSELHAQVMLAGRDQIEAGVRALGGAVRRHLARGNGSRYRDSSVHV